MLGSALQSSNPALNNGDAFEQFYGSLAEKREEVTTLQGVVNKTTLLVGVAVVAGAGGYALVEVFPNIMWISAIAAFVIALGFFWKLRGNPALAPVLAPIYAVIQGVFLGAMTGALDRVLIAYRPENVMAGGLALQAFVITISIVLAMLGLYYARILQPTRMFKSVVVTLTLGVMVMYLLSFLLSFFGVWMPLISLQEAFTGGTGAWIALGVNVLILGLASLWLIIDFGLVEEKVNQGAPKHMEWYCAFALLVTLAWIYFEAVKIAFRVAMIVGNRD